MIGITDEVWQNVTADGLKKYTSVMWSSSLAGLKLIDLLVMCIIDWLVLGPSMLHITNGPKWQPYKN